MRYSIPKTLIEIFSAGADRPLAEMAPIPLGDVLNLGAGKKEIVGTFRLDADMGWRAPIIPYPDDSVAGIIAFHFLEHLAKDDLLKTIQEAQRVLIVGGSLIAVMPHWSSELAHQDLDHKSFWSEQTWTNLINNPYYDGTMPRDWRFKIHLNVMMGLVQRNLMLVSQLIKT